jgi:hypothetical protein
MTPFRGITFSERSYPCMGNQGLDNYSLGNCYRR